MPADTGLQQQQVLEDAEVAGKALCMNSEHLIEAGPQTAPFFATPMWGLGLPERITNRMARNAPPKRMARNAPPKRMARNAPPKRMARNAPL